MPKQTRVALEAEQPQNTDPLVMVSYRLPASYVEAIDVLAKVRNTTRASLVRAWLEECIERESRPEVVRARIEESYQDDLNRLASARGRIPV
ncbi:MAG: hypothetical protein ACOYBY_16145 [Dermatophilaceae bacterium]